MIVELQIFSGRRNPSWQLDAEERDGFLALLDSIKDTSTPRIMPEHLGYRGFLVTREANELGRFVTIYIFQNIALVEGESTTKYYQDPAKKLEKYLLESAGKHLDNDLWSKLKNEIEKESNNSKSDH